MGQVVHKSSARGLRINELLHQHTVRKLVRREKIDIVISGIGHQSVGLPPADLDVPLIFDYLDFKLEQWPEVEREYLRIADAVLCTSQVLVDRVERVHPHTFYLPNGVDVEAAATANGSRVRQQYGLDGSKVVSLIGITASTNLFYVDAMADAARETADLTFLLVGDGGALGQSMISRAHERGLRVVATGPVSPTEVADFFAATDVGLYPGDQTPYFDAACPLKVLEYTAAGKAVVATDLAELRNWGFPNVSLTAPTAEAFGQAITAALREPPTLGADLDRFRWSRLSRQLLTILDEVAGRSK
jgi:glycosyltransferase involved in cell wall biosynthesis